MSELRLYQANAVDRVLWAMKYRGNDVLSLPTGSGKSHIVSALAQALDREIVILQPSLEILEQNVSKLQSCVPKNEIGIFSASARKKRVSRYTFATIGSVYRCPERFKDIGMVIIDECHLVNQKRASGMYMTFLKALKHPKTVGLTATAYRNVTAYHKLEKRYAHQPDQFIAEITLKLITRTADRSGKRFWDRLLYNVNVGDLIDEGFLCQMRYEDITLLRQDEIPLNSSRTDFDLDAYERRLGSREMQIIERIERAQEEFNSILVFCSSVRQAEKFSECVPGSQMVSAKTKPERRDAIINGFKQNKIQTVFNVGVLTTGFDHPSLDCVVLNRPTRSLSLYYQIAGRGLRVAPGKPFCTLIDFTNTVRELGRIETIRLEKDEDGWDVITETGRWHNRALYRYKITKQKDGTKTLERGEDRGISQIEQEATLF